MKTRHTSIYIGQKEMQVASLNWERIVVNIVYDRGCRFAAYPGGYFEF